MPGNNRSHQRNASGQSLRRRSIGRIALAAAAVVVVASVMLLVREVRRVPSPAGARTPGRAETNPLTDVAGRSLRAPGIPALGATAEEAFQNAIERGQRVVKPAPYVLPKEMPDPSHPPRWTAPLTEPSAPVPPSPFTPPKIAQDPDRGRPHGP